MLALLISACCHCTAHKTYPGYTVSFQLAVALTCDQEGLAHKVAGLQPREK
jgi:hypothetical protein